MQPLKHAKADQPNQFHLLRRLSITSLVAMLITSATLTLLYRQDQISGYEKTAAQQNKKAANQLMRLLENQIGTLVANSNGLGPQAIRANPDIDMFAAALKNIHENHIFKLKIFNLSGATVFSSARSEIGTAYPYPNQLAQALRGEVLHKIEFHQTILGASGEVQDRYIAHTFMPLSYAGKRIGAIELYEDATPIYKLIDANTIRIALIVFFAFAVLYAALFFTVLRTDRAVAEWQKIIAKSEELFRAVFDNVAVGIAQISVKGLFLQINNEFCQIIGYSREEVLSQEFTFHRITAPEDIDTDQANVNRLLGGSGDRYTREKRYIRKNGEIIWVSLSLYLVRNDAGEPLYFISAVKDITERKHAEEELRIAATAFESQDGMIVTNASSVILRVNHAFTDITGYLAEEAIGKTPQQLLKSGRQDAAFYAAMWESIHKTGAWKGEIWNRRKSGDVYPEQLTITAVKGDGEKVTHYVATLHDITNRKAAEDQIRNLAFYDTLTHLPNRRMLNDRLGQTMAASKRSGCYAALMFLDLDNFKPINDTHGHGVGDLLLKEVASRLTSCVREVDTVSRFGGDEFVVMLSELDKDKQTSTAQASIVAEKIRTTLAEPFLLTFKHEKKVETAVEHHCTASIGVVLFINHEASAEDILKWADMAMYQAKDAGRNLVRFYEEKV
ncbi:MAG: PAS domain S-box protein [Gallionella sp.]|nr:PAS domain S-box protein [Gallionella sp.]